MSLARFLLSFKGRISRLQYWVFTLALVAVLTTLVLASTLGSHTDARLGYADAVALLWLWPAFAVEVKRWHDRDKSAWWLLINFIPLIGPLWVFVELGFLKGTAGPNRYGPSPIAPAPVGSQ